RVAYGGMMGGITNIDRDGFGSAAFHSWPDSMAWDFYTGDYGMGFFGHAYAAATYLVDDPNFGWLAYGGNLFTAGATITVVPKDGARTRLFVAPVGVWVTLEAGKIASAAYVPATGAITLTLDPANANTPAARVFVETTTKAGRHYATSSGTEERGARTIALSGKPTVVMLTPR
ncbi:MAG: DUF5695 domain-containing protein, partial [Pseudomonadota bacterium]|nr:DUF5695 domain-containing protein [Pseudomonadota bacterium]